MGSLGSGLVALLAVVLMTMVVLIAIGIACYPVWESVLLGQIRAFVPF